MISIGNVAPDRGDIAPIKGQIPTGSTWDQYIPIVDEAGLRLDLDNYNFELTFTSCDATTPDLRLGTVSGEILKTTDADGDTLRVFASPTVLADMCGAYTCSFAAKNASNQYWLLARGTVTFLETPPAFA